MGPFYPRGALWTLPYASTAHNTLRLTGRNGRKNYITKRGCPPRMQLPEMECCEVEKFWNWIMLRALECGVRLIEWRIELSGCPGADIRVGPNGICDNVMSFSVVAWSIVIWWISGRFITGLRKEWSIGRIIKSFVSLCVRRSKLPVNIPFWFSVDFSAKWNDASRAVPE